MKRIVLILMIWVAFNGCTRTINAWNGATPKEYLEVYGKEDLPLKLEEKKVEYRCVDLVYSSEGYTKKCYVTKSSADKIDGWSSRLYATSKGALLDTGENVIILGILAICSIGGDCSMIDISKMKE
ncbi:MAG: hypothetical protein KU29_09525 [Sulfurovum sp. FS06-10]|jgi:hypothetical protein|nr:MAG: hypothetical protein KU29_09525 [Sulfurovum sp. FS06-10]